MFQCGVSMVVPSGDCLVAPLLPDNRLGLIRENKKHCRAILPFVRGVWKADVKRIFPEIYGLKEDNSLSVDEVLCLGDGVNVPSPWRGENEIFGAVTMLVARSWQWSMAAKHCNDCEQSSFSAPEKNSLAFSLWGLAACSRALLWTFLEEILHICSS